MLAGYTGSELPKQVRLNVLEQALALRTLATLRRNHFEIFELFSLARLVVQKAEFAA